MAYSSQQKQAIVRHWPLRKAGTALTRILVNLVMTFFTVISLYPLLWMVLSSFKTGKDFASNMLWLPRQFYLENYPKAIKVTNMGTAAMNSLYVTVSATLLILAFAFIIAYFVNRYRFPGRRVVYGLFLVGMLIPVYSFLVPVYVMFSRLGLTNSLTALILPNTALALPLAVILIENFLTGIPIDMEEAALIDGASLSQRILRVVLPLASPIISTLLILEIIWVWNEFPFALTLINDATKRTLPLTISNFKGEFDIDFTPLFAALVMTSIPVVAIYFAFSERIMEGMTAGAVKG